MQKKDLDPSILIYESLAILIISLSIIVLRLRNPKDSNPKEVKNRKKQIIVIWKIILFYKMVKNDFI